MNVPGSLLSATIAPAADRESVLADWRGAKAQVTSRIAGIVEYRQHVLEPGDASLWPSDPALDTTPPERVPDAIGELLLARRRYASSGRLGRALANDTALFEGARRAKTSVRCIVTTLGPGAGARAILFFRRRRGSSRGALARVLVRTLARAFAREPGTLELRVVLAARGTPIAGSYDAAMIVGAATPQILDLVIRAVANSEASARLARRCAAVHTSRIGRTNVLTLDGRPTLPQLRPEARPRLDPVVSTIKPWTARADETGGARPFPPARLIPIGAEGPEDVVADARGRLLCGVLGGTILRIDPATLAVECVGDTGGRPLGLEALPDGRVLICDAHRGLLRLDPETGALETLVDYVEGLPLRFCSNATAAADGTMWFTEATTRFDQEQYQGALLEGRASGRLLRRDPDGTVTVERDDLDFGNGLTLTSDETAVLYVETFGHRLNRLWVAGPRRGQREVLVDGLPGFPDNVSRMKDGRFWIAMASSRTAGIEAISKAPPFVRSLIWRLPPSLSPGPTSTVWAMAFDEDGNLLDDLQTTRADFGFVTGVVELDGKLVLSSLTGTNVLEVDLAH